jgi:hypothetical protein
VDGEGGGKELKKRGGRGEKMGKEKCELGCSLLLGEMAQT